MPKQVQITAKVPKLSKEATATYTTGETSAESIQLFGDAAVNSNANSNWGVVIQGAMRRWIEQGKSPAEIQTLVAGMKMGVSLPRGTGDPVAAIKNKWASMSEEDRKALLQALRTMK